MKKLMIVAAAVMLGITANAAKANWSGANVTLTGTEAAPTDWTVLLLDSAKISSANLGKMFADYSAGTVELSDLTAAINGAKVLDTVGVAAGTPATAGRWVSSGAVLPESYVNGQGVSFYTLILDDASIKDGTVSIADEGNYLLTADKTGTVSSSTALNMAFGDQSAAKWNAYSSVPEPTSGLLLLLGVAGLALRRRRA